jgi:hypothetical protein
MLEYSNFKIRVKANICQVGNMNIATNSLGELRIVASYYHV